MKTTIKLGRIATVNFATDHEDDDSSLSSEDFHLPEEMYYKINNGNKSSKEKGRSGILPPLDDLYKENLLGVNLLKEKKEFLNREAILELKTLREAVSSEKFHRRKTALERNAEYTNMEEQRLQELEKWCARRGKNPAERFSNDERKALRHWFQALDEGGRGRIQYEQLLDPMISTGVFHSELQVRRVINNMNNVCSGGIDYREFIGAMENNNFRSLHRIMKLPHLIASQGPDGLDGETVLTQERRRGLLQCVMRASERRLKAYDTAIAVIEKPTRSERVDNQRSTGAGGTGASHYEHDLDRIDSLLSKIEKKNRESIQRNEKYLGALHQVITSVKEQQQRRQLESSQPSFASIKRSKNQRSTNMYSTYAPRGLSGIPNTLNTKNTHTTT